VLFDDTYRTLAAPSEGFFKDKGSKFFAYAYPIQSEQEVKKLLEELREIHPKARHHCYAWRMGMDKNHFRANDDGEPSGSAGRPILNTLYSHDVTNVLVVVVRYFGGTLLGIPGLINAYKTATVEALTAAELVSKHLTDRYELNFPYPQMNAVMTTIKEMDLPVLEQQFDLNCRILLEVRKTQLERFALRVEKIDDLVVTLL
jgi:uncharacterized YigZ family protein